MLCISEKFYADLKSTIQIWEVLFRSEKFLFKLSTWLWLVIWSCRKEIFFRQKRSVLEAQLDEKIVCGDSASISSFESAKVMLQLCNYKRRKYKYLVSLYTHITCHVNLFLLNKIWKETLLGFSPILGFPRINHGVYCAWILCDVMCFYFQQYLLLLS